MLRLCNDSIEPAFMLVELSRPDKSVLVLIGVSKTLPMMAEDDFFLESFFYLQSIRGSIYNGFCILVEDLIIFIFDWILDYSLYKFDLSMGRAYLLLSI